MLESIKNLSFEQKFKATLLLLIAYFLLLLTILIYKKSDIGRYQVSPDALFIFDTKTGKFKE
jgi:hypothetical protein